jgi:hypothetical protein
LVFVWRASADDAVAEKQLQFFAFGPIEGQDARFAL